MFSPVSNGGLNIVHFSTKCVSLRLSCLASLGDSFGSEKWHFLTRYFLGNRLVKFDKRFSFASNSIPPSSMPSFFYKQCLDNLAFLFSKLGSLPDNLTCKNIYSLLLVLPSVVPKSAGFWGSVVGRPIDPSPKWRPKI